MQQQGAVLGSAPANQGASTQDRRKLWILTGYTVSFLAMCGVLAYYFSAYITH